MSVLTSSYTGASTDILIIRTNCMICFPMWDDPHHWWIFSNSVYHVGTFKVLKSYAVCLNFVLLSSDLSIAGSVPLPVDHSWNWGRPRWCLSKTGRQFPSPSTSQWANREGVFWIVIKLCSHVEMLSAHPSFSGCLLFSKIYSRHLYIN